MKPEAVYALWKREVKGLARDKAMLFSPILTAVLWLGIFGAGIGEMRFGGAALDYNQFIFPGIVGMAVLITSIRSGVSILRDREFGFLRVILAAPLSRSMVVAGKLLGDGTAATLQGIVVLVLAFAVGLSPGPAAIASSVLTMFLLSIGLVGLGMAVASRMDSFEGFNLVMSALFLPMFFLSGALFPARALPDLLAEIAYFNPLTYGVDALRGIFLGQGQAEFSLLVDLSVLASFFVLMAAVDILSFRDEL